MRRFREESVRIGNPGSGIIALAVIESGSNELVRLAAAAVEAICGGPSSVRVAVIMGMRAGLRSGLHSLLMQARWGHTTGHSAFHPGLQHPLRSHASRPSESIAPLSLQSMDAVTACRRPDAPSPGLIPPSVPTSIATSGTFSTEA